MQTNSHFVDPNLALLANKLAFFVNKFAFCVPVSSSWSLMSNLCSQFRILYELMSILCVPVSSSWEKNQHFLGTNLYLSGQIRILCPEMEELRILKNLNLWPQCHNLREQCMNFFKYMQGSVQGCRLYLKIQLN